MKAKWKARKTEIIEEAREAANLLDGYMRFRAEKEGLRYELTPEFYEEAILLLGIRSFFGVVVSGSKLVHDEQQPNMFEQWKSERERR